ncbi:MAG: M23 family metallopeptidase, partial [Bacteroidales bacterium]|nr:M23 family metallopeptidase [Bacteroidales bacterium]
ADLPKINKNPLPTNPYFKVDSLSSYYLSIQLPIPLNQTVPTSIFHRFIFQDTVKNTTVTVEGAQFTPRTSESPLVIASPVKGKNWMFINQSTYNYHFNAMFFVNGKIGTGERYAFDNLQFDDDGNYFIGDPTKNESYFNYKDTLYAIADGTVMLIQDNLPENDGNSQNIKFNTANELAGNYLILDIGGGHYAFYCHCNPGSFMTKVGRTVKEGDPIALLGNSGNSTAPHLHFQICDSQELFMTNGLPFVLKQYTKVGEKGFLTPPSTVYSNSMMEEFSEISFE